jgi:uncharacterized protein
MYAARRAVLPAVLPAVIPAVIPAVFVSLWLAATSALAAPKFNLPPIDSHVVDTSGLLTQADRQALDARAAAIQKQTGFDIVVFAVGSLEDQDIADVAFAAFNGWGIGTREKDNGVLLVWAPKERKLRIETGKGVGGELTDLQSNDILRKVIEPPLKQGLYRQALDAGIVAIARSLTGGAYSPADAPQPRYTTRPIPEAPRPLDPLTLLLGIAGFIVFVFLMIVSSTFRGLVWAILRGLMFFSGRGGGGGGSDGRSGGTGRSGGGGSSDGY